MTSEITRRRMMKLLNGVAAATGAAVVAGKAATTAFAQQVKDTLGAVLPFPPVPTASTAGPTLQESKHVRRAEPNHLPPDAPNILIVLLDDVGFGLAGHAWRRGPYADVDAPRQRGHRLQPVPYDLDLLADAGGAADRAQSPARRVRHDRRAGARFRRLHRRHPKTAATVAKVLRDYGYKTAAFGKWHNTPATETTAMGPFDRWPTGYGFDYFYGFMAGETSQYEPRLFENTNPIEPPHDPNLSSEFGHGGQGARLAEQASRLRARQAVPDVLGAGRRARAAPHLQGMGGQIQRQVRRRLGRLSRARLQAAEGARLDSAGHEAHAARRYDGVVGQHSGIAAPVPAPADGGLRRLRRARRRAGRPARRRARRDGNPRQHDHLLCLRRQRFERRGPERHDQRTSRAEHDPQHDRTAAGGARQDRRSRCARDRQDRQHVSRRLGLGRRHAVPIHEARRLAFRRHAQPAGRSRGRRASSPTRRRGRSSTTSTTSRRRSTISSASSRRRSSTDGSRSRSTASAWPTPSATPRRRAAS